MLRKRFAIGLGGAGLLLVLALAILFALTGSSGDREAHSKFATDPDAVRTSGRDSPGESPIGGYEAYLSAERTYPADVIPPAVVENARATFDKIASQGDNSNGNNRFQPFGPLQNVDPAGRDVVQRRHQHDVEPGHGARDRTHVCGRKLPPVGWQCGRRRLAHGRRSRRESDLDVAERRPRAELGRLARCRPERSDRQHALPRHR